jgi:hypothetical protein
LTGIAPRKRAGALVGHHGVLDEGGTPVVSGGGEHPSAPGLYFIGYRADLSGQLRLMRGDARAIARAVRLISARYSDTRLLDPG